jgi:peptidoglycan/LPS O-acetylase OafA/YrhL
MGNAPQGRFYELDSLRGIAAVAVVVFHYQFDFFDRANYTTAYPFPKGYLAVDLFFVLSGVVLAYRYGQELRSGTLPVWRFMFARLTRLYPLHLPRCYS